MTTAAPTTLAPTTAAPTVAPTTHPPVPAIPMALSPERWAQDRNLGPWPFVPQLNKWGYLNNPRWRPIPRAFVRGGPDDYDGRESEEPQIYKPDPGPKYPSGSELRHHQCGHWHKPRPTTLAPTTVIPPEFLPWYSCPMMTIPLGNDGDVLFITSDDKLEQGIGDTTFYIMKYVGSTGVWSSTFTKTITGDPSDDYVEPDCFWAMRGAIKVACLYIAGPPDDTFGIEIYVLNGETIINTNFIQCGASTVRGSLVTTTGQGHLALIDNLGYIHIIVMQVKAGATSLYDYISTDNGATFNAVLIKANCTTTSVQLRFLMQTSDNKLWQSGPGLSVFTSVDNGATWAAPISQGTVFVKLDLFNDTFIGIEKASPNIKFYISSNCTAWTLKHTINDTLGGHSYAALLNGAGIAYDGTYYYIALNMRNDTSGSPLPNGFTNIYRSSDLDTWTLVGTVQDDKEALPPASGTYYPNLDITASAGRLFLSFYYSELESLIYPGVFFLTHWESSDLGVTWTPITSPFYDMTTGVAP